MHLRRTLLFDLSRSFLALTRSSLVTLVTRFFALCTSWKFDHLRGSPLPTLAFPPHSHSPTPCLSLDTERSFLIEACLERGSPSFQAVQILHKIDMSVSLDALFPRLYSI